MQNQDPSTRAVLVSLNISTWSARKYDKAISQEVARKYAATLQAGRYNKCLLPGDADSYQRLLTLAGEIRTFHYANTLPWSDDGWRMLPTSNYMEYANGIRQKIEAFANGADTFAGEYPSMKARAEQLLNGMYKDADYPEDISIRGRFMAGIKYNPLPQAGDFRMDLPASEIQAMEQATADRIKQAVAAAHRDMWERLHTCVAHIAEQLGNPKGKIYDSLLENADELMDIMQRLNGGIDPKLDEMCNQLRITVSSSTRQLRANKRVRHNVAQEADALLKSIESVFSPAGGRNVY